MFKITPKAFFFDFDGVVADSEGLHFKAALKAAQPHGISFDRAYYDTWLLGYDDRNLFLHLWKDHGQTLPELKLKNLMLVKNQLFHQLIVSDLKFFDGLNDFIQQFKDRQIPIAIVSGALEDEILACLKQGGLNEFEFIVAANHVHHSKPDPESYELAFDKMCSIVPSLSKNDCWTIEDSCAGIISASMAGLKVIGITHSLPADKLSQANLVISKFNEIEIGTPARP